tara:strand:+ start:287 stop:745 length:459 start_codon:yes stop_codon:yes gene_type:complete
MSIYYIGVWTVIKNQEHFNAAVQEFVDQSFDWCCNSLFLYDDPDNASKFAAQIEDRLERLSEKLAKDEVSQDYWDQMHVKAAAAREYASRISQMSEEDREELGTRAIKSSIKDTYFAPFYGPGLKEVWEKLHNRSLPQPPALNVPQRAAAYN